MRSGFIISGNLVCCMCWRVNVPRPRRRSRYARRVDLSIRFQCNICGRRLIPYEEDALEFDAQGNLYAAIDEARDTYQMCIDEGLRYHGEVRIPGVDSSLMDPSSEGADESDSDDEGADERFEECILELTLLVRYER